MSIHDEANLLLKLYELRREETMRKARDWYFLEFNPASIDDVKAALFSPQSGYLRMVMSYWDMAAALVNHGAINMNLFNETNGEHLGVFAKVEPLLSEVRGLFGPQALVNLEKLIDATPGARERMPGIRERAKAVLAEVTAFRAAAAQS
jgi:hypothetical protein